MILGGFLFAFLGGLVLIWSSVYDRNSRHIYPKAEIKGLEIAIKGYKTEYLRLPFSGTEAPVRDNEPFDTTDANGRALLDILLAKNKAQNPREIFFWDPPPQRSNQSGFAAERGLVDSWGKQGYKMILDYNGDGKITNPYGASEGEPDELNADIIIYSAGANGIFEPGASKDGKRTDDVKSWQ